MKASDLFVRALEHEGVEFIFGIPGEENLDLLESLRKSKIRLVLTRHEQAAGFMAATYGRLTGRVGVCLSTLGPGATNLVTAAAYAQLGAMPILMVTGQKPIDSSKQGRFQIIDVVEMMRPITKLARQIVHGNRIPAFVREAVNTAEAERPGAVHLELPEDVAREEAEPRLFPISKARRPAPDPSSVAKALEMLGAARAPLILVGAAANRNRITEALREWIDHSGIPFFNTQMGKGVIDERHPLFLGTAALSSGDSIHYAIDHADLIVNVGHDVIEKPPFFMELGGTRVIHINNFAAEVDEVYFPQLEIVGDIASTLRALTAGLQTKSQWDFSYYDRARKVVNEHVAVHATDSRFPLLPPRIVADVRAAVPADGIVTLDNGMYKIWFARNYPARAHNTLILDNALASMGAGLPSAIAAKIVHPDLEVVTVCGDGGFLMNSQELETAVRLGLDLVVIVLRDDALGMIQWKQQAEGFERFGLQYGNPDFVRYAESYGAHGHRVERTEDFQPLLGQCLSEPGVHLIEVPVDYSEDDRILGLDLRERCSEQLSD